MSEPRMPPPGMCAGCGHARILTNRRGSVFILCGLAASDPRFRRYPELPVLRCDGFEQGEPGRTTEGGPPATGAGA